MHDLKSNYLKIKKQVRLALKDSLDQRDNLHFYPNSPKMSDLEIISLAITAECLEIDSENLLWSKLKKDYSLLFPNLVHRTRFNQRRRGLKDWIVYCADQLADQIPTEEQLYIVDSIPIPVCKLSREKSSKVCRKPTDVVKASKGYFAADKSYFWGFRLHLITSLSGVFQELKILPANVHDIHFLKQLTQSHLYDCKLIGDRAYRSNPLQLSLFEQFQIDLQVPYRINQKDRKVYPKRLTVQRKMIETTFSQYCDQLNLKRNYAKSTEGLFARTYSKIAAITFKQLWNHLNGNKISKTKHSLAA